MNNEEANIEQIQDNTAEISSVELNAETPVEETQQQEFFPVAEVAPEVEIPTPEPEPVPEPVLEVVTPVAIPDEKVADEPVPVIPVEVEQPKEEPIIVETPKMEEVVEASSASEPAVTEPIAAEPAVIEPAVSEPAAETPLAAVATEQPASEEHKDQKHEKAVWGEKFEAVYQELLLVKENNGTIEVEIKGRIRGGLRAIYKEMPLFLPASHFSLKRTPTEQELTDAAGKTMVVQVHELQEYDEGRKAVIVSRKHLLTEDFWTRISVGDIVEGKVSSIATFGVFVDLGGVEGLIHISRLSQVHVDDPNKFMKKGDTVKAVVVELDRTKNRIALSRKELEESPWKDVETLFLVGTQHTGIVRRLTDFGAYIELKPGVDGLLRTPEISWTKRIKKPSDVLKANSEIPVEILSVSEDKQTVSLSYKKTQPNPWHQLVDKYPVGTEYQGIVSQVMPQGCIIAINDEVDGFMPRSKMKHILQGNKIPYHPGDSINVLIADLIPDEESLILAPVVEEGAKQQPDDRRRNFNNRNEDSKPKQPQAAAQTGISFGDFLSESDRKNLFNHVDDE